jgi:hypothetical protein
LRTPTKIEQHIGLPLVPTLRRLYGGDDTKAVEGSKQRVAMGLMSADDVIKTFETLRGFMRLYDSAPFWQGLNGEYALVYLDGPLKPRVYFIDYDGRETSVAYRSVESFLDAMSQAKNYEQNDWFTVATDYFIESQYYLHGVAVCRPASAGDFEKDLLDRELLRGEYRPEKVNDDIDERYYAFNIMSLTPPDRTEEIISFLDSDDMCVQERACRILGHRNCERAIDRLVCVARTGMVNGRGAALRALKKMKFKVAQRLANEIESERTKS